MKFKLDENLGKRTYQIFINAGYDAQTILEEDLQGATDQAIYEVCSTEKRCLITLDLDFADITRFQPKNTGGIVVIRVPRNPSLGLLSTLVRQFLKALQQETVVDNLWIVEIGQIRIHQRDE